jgi:hypothetical protein
MIQQRGDAEGVSSRNMRLPLQIRAGGKAGRANMDGGDLGRGSGTMYDVAQVTPVFFRHAVKISKLVEFASNAPEKAIENTAAAGNFVYFDDVILSQGPVTPNLRLAPLRDSQNPTVYGSLGISQHLNQGAANTFAGTVALAAGTATVKFPTAYNSAPGCTANDTSTIATERVQTTATALTLTQSSGTDRIAYICVGNPN